MGSRPTAVWLRIAVAAVAVSYAVLYMSHSAGGFTAGGLAHGDGVYHYAYLRSWVLDFDLDFRNDYALLGDPHHQLGAGARNRFGMGSAVAWLPFFIVGQGLAWFGNAVGVWSDPLDGTSALVQRITLSGSVVCAVAAVGLSVRVAATRFSPLAAAVAGVAVAWGSALPWYATRQPSFSHAVSACAVAGFVYAVDRLGPDPRPRTLALVGVGLLAGAMAMVRPADAVFIAVPLVAFAAGPRSGGWPTPTKTQLRRVGWVAVAAVVGFAPQMFVWWKLYGSPLTIPQGAAYMVWGHSRWADVLWSSRGGALSWHPLLWLGSAGLVGVAIAGASRRRPLAVGLLVATVAAAYVAGTAEDWWGGWAFGGRRLCGATVAWVFGLAAVIEWITRRRRWAWAAVAVLVAVAVRVNVGLASDFDRGVVARGRPVDLRAVGERALGVDLGPLYATIGHPGSVPANWIFAARHGVDPARYDDVMGWEVVVTRGDAKGYDRLWIGQTRWVLGGFGPAAPRGEHVARTIVADAAAVAVPLRRPMALQARVRLWSDADDTQVRLRLGSSAWERTARRGWSDLEVSIPASATAAGVNALVVERSPGSEIAMAWVDLWLTGTDHPARDRS